MRTLRFWIVSLLLAVSAFLLYRRANIRPVVPGEPLAGVPATLQGWSGVDQPIDPAALEILGDGDFLSRIYRGPVITPPVGLFIAYFPIQKTGFTIHPPKVCLPGSGWSFESSEYLSLRDARSNPHRVGEYVIANSDEKQFVIYWYQAHGRTVPNEYMAKLHMAMDAIRSNRTDGALVRITTVIAPSEGVTGARRRAEWFAAELLPSLSRFIPD